jgi:hypothetical protein
LPSPGFSGVSLPYDKLQILILYRYKFLLLILSFDKLKGFKQLPRLIQNLLFAAKGQHPPGFTKLYPAGLINLMIVVLDIPSLEAE